MIPNSVKDALASSSDNNKVQQQVQLLDQLVTKGGQSHLLDAFNNKTQDKIKLQALAAQLLKLDTAMKDAGGLMGYIEQAKSLLEASKQGVNPLDGWKPSIPKGEKLELGTEQYDATEQVGMKLLGKVGFVLVAGGLGERLGYNGAKV